MARTRVRRPLPDRVLDRKDLAALLGIAPESIKDQHWLPRPRYLNKRRPSWLMSEVMAAWRALPDVLETTREVA